MWTPSYDIIVETLTGSEFEVTVNDRNTVGYLKSEIQKYEGIPTSQQHLLYQHKELSDSMEMKDIPLVKGSRVKLVLGMKGGPISSKRLFAISSDYDNWLDMSDVLSGEDLINLQSPGLKLLLYKDNKKNVHRLMKVRAEKASDGMKGSMSRSIIGSGAAGQGAFGIGGYITQKERDAAITKKKMSEIKAMLSMKKKRLGVAQSDKKVADGGNEQQEPQGSEEPSGDRAGACSSDITDASTKAGRSSSSQYRHKKRHHHYHHHHHHQHETVIKEEKTPIGYRPGTGRGTTGGSASGGTALVAGGHNASMVGAIGSLLPSSGMTSAPHRKSMPAVIDVERSEQEPPFGYGLVNLLHGTATTTGRSSTLEMEKRSQIREHLQRNRSFKTISAKNLDFARDGSPQLGGGSGNGRLSGSAGLERSLSFHSNGVLNRMDSETTLDGYSNFRRYGAGGSQTRGNGPRLGGGSGVGGSCTTQSLHKLDESRVSSTSLHDLIELLKYTQSKQRTISNDSLNKLMLNYSKKVYIPHHLYHHSSATGKKSLPDINPSLNNIEEYLPDYEFGVKVSSGAGNGSAAAAATTTATSAMPNVLARSEDGLDCKIASAEYAFKNAGAGGIDKPFRTLYKSTSDDSSVYELPKLLVREDSPVESFLGSYSQLETVATRRGDSPKNNFAAASSGLQDVDRTATAHTDAPNILPETGLLDLRPLGSTSSATIVGEAKLASESLLQLAQLAAESVKSGGGGASAEPLTASPVFTSNVSNVAAGSTSAKGVATNGVGSSSTTWCHHWNNRQQQHQADHEGPFTSSLQHLNNPRHHHSDLGINELELKFVHSDAAPGRIVDAGIATTDETVSDYTNMIKLPAITNLEASNGWLQLSTWDNVSYDREDDDADDEEVLGEEEEDEDDVQGQDEEEDDDRDDEENGQDRDRVTSSSCSSMRRPRESSNSTSFIHSHLSISSDEDDLLNVAEVRHGAGAVGSAYKPGGNKSKSIDLNEFRKAFGSSPTLLNGFGGGTSCTRLVPQLSRLETIPSQYRRGYTNLNDACLSSSTSELECVNNGAAKKKHPGLLPRGDDSGVLSSTLLKYRKDGSIPYVRSNENLNRYKVSLSASSTSMSGANRRRMGDSDEGLASSDALYMRQRQQSAPGTRHLPGIRDHLASIVDAEVNEANDANSGTNERASFTDENGNANRCFTVGGDFECRFSRLSCCSAAGGEGTSKAFSSGVGRSSGASYRHKEHPSAGGGAGFMRAASSEHRNDHTRFMFGEDGSSMQYNGAAANSSSTSLRPSDYYFPSDESLFNMDSFFDDFVEIDPCDIIESTEFININGSSRRKGSDSFGASGGLVLPDIHANQQQQQSQPHQQQEQSYPYFSVDENPDLQPQQYRLLNTFKSFTSAGGDDARKQLYRTVGLRGGSEASDVLGEGEIHFSARRAFLRAGQNVEDDDEEEGIASIIQHIDREQLCEHRASSADTTIASSIIVHDDRERLLRLSDSPTDRQPSPGVAGPNVTQQHTTSEPIKSKKLRCAQCNKKLGVIMIMKCHCEKIFCAQHRYAEAHNCSYNFKVAGRKELEKNNPLVVADKLPKI